MNPIVLMSVLLNFSTCNRDSTESSISLPPQKYLNVSYGRDSAQKMDVYLPKNRKQDSTKVIVLLHGGAWSGGDKRDLAFYVSELQQRLPDYAIFNVNYRLATQLINHFPTQENDVQTAIDFILSKRDDYTVSTKMVLLGASAGAHLALLHAYKHSNPVVVKAVVSFFGPTDLEDMYNSQVNEFYRFAFGLLIGGTPLTNKAAYQQSSPLYFASAQSCPTLLLHGGKDHLVSSAQAVALKTKLQAAGVNADLVIYPNEGHGWYGARLNDSFQKIAAFLKANVK